MIQALPPIAATPLSNDLITPVLPFPRIGGRLFTRADKKYTGRPRHPAHPACRGREDTKKSLESPEARLTGGSFIGPSEADKHWRFLKRTRVHAVHRVSARSSRVASQRRHGVSLSQKINRACPV